jgi:uroporphyrinogen decarboxylase
MKPRDIVLEQICHRETRPIPFTLGFEGGVDERLDEHYGGSAWRERIPRYIVAVSTVDADRNTPVDEAHYRDAFGSVWSTAGRPFHLDQPAMRSPSFDGYDFPAAEVFVDAELGRQALEVCRQHADSFLVAGFGWGLSERTWNLRGFEQVLVDVMTEPDFYDELVDRITDLHLRFVEASARLPVDGIMFSDDWGDQRGVTIGPERWRRHLKPRLARLYQAVHDAGKLTLSHCCGSVAAIMPDIIEIGLDVLESVQPEAAGMDPYQLKRQWGDRITFWGGLGAQSTVPFGTPETIAAEIERLCAEMPRGGGYILSPAKPLQPGTPTANAVAVLEAMLRFTGN